MDDKVGEKLNRMFNELDKARQELKSRNENVAGRGFIKICDIYSRLGYSDVGDFSALFHAYNKNFYINEWKFVEYTFVNALEKYFANLYPDQYEEVMQEIARTEMTGSERGVFTALCRTHPCKIPDIIEKLLDNKDDLLPSFLISERLCTQLEKGLDDVYKKHPSLAINEIFPAMKEAAEKRDSYPLYLFSCFGDQGMEYLLGLKPDYMTGKMILNGLNRFKDERILQLGLAVQPPLDILIGDPVISILVNYKEDQRARDKLVDCIAQDCYFNTRILDELVGVDDDKIAERVVKKGRMIFLSAKQFLNENSDFKQTIKMRIVSQLFIPLAQICGERIKDQLIEKSKSSRSEIRAPAYTALGWIGEVEILKKTITNDRSKWVKFFAALGLIASGKEDEVKEGMAFVENALKKYEKGDPFKEELVMNNIEINIFGGGLTAMLEGLKSEHEELRFLCQTILEVEIEERDSWDDLNQIREKLSEIGASCSISSDPSSKDKGKRISALYAKVSDRMNELSPKVEIMLDGPPKVPKPPKKGGEGPFRIMKRLCAE
jgi:hypothetical protein